MKKRKTLVLCEILFTIISFICICVSVFYGFSSIDHSISQESILNINKKNIETLKAYLKMSSNYDKIPSIENAKKIQYSLKYDTDEYTIIYKDGTKKDFNDRELNGLRAYINDNGYELYVKDRKFMLIFLIGSVVAFFRGKSYGNKIELQDKLEMEKRERVNTDLSKYARRTYEK